MRVAVTGASGFIGGHVVAGLQRQGVSVVPLVRRGGAVGTIVDLGNPVELAEILAGVDVLIHCAGLAHAQESGSREEKHRHDLVNCTYVLNTALAAAEAGVRRFVFCSSVKAVGDPGVHCVDETFDAPATTAYGLAKRAAERGLADTGNATGLQIVVLRLSMVYGPGSRGNLERMLRLVAARRFPPLPETRNKRSMVHISDVVEAVRLATVHPTAAGGTYIVAHPQAVSGRELYDLMCEACFGARKTWSVPAALFWSAAKLGDIAGTWFGIRSPIDSQSVSRLLESACYSPATIQSELGWHPKTNLSTGIQQLLSSAGTNLDG